MAIHQNILCEVFIMNTEIAEKIKAMLVENLRIPADELEYTSELFGDDIGLDSIDSIEIIAGIDNLFGVQMTGAARENFQTIETLTKFVEEHME
ncbi:MAG: acyl carrier protein [Oscillospiraceae bacterium]|nr:acyl carrier protein [Oscillospiraceae bacterium]